MFKRLIIAFTALIVTACGAQKITPLDYTQFHNEKPRSILVVPVLNNSNEPEAADFFLTTLPIPLAEKGYYVFPTNMVKRAMEADGLSDANLVHTTDPKRLGEIFGADTIVYVEILKWESKYKVFSANTEVEFKYTLKSAESGFTLWESQKEMIYAASGNSGNFIADLIVNAISATIGNMQSDFTPLALQANTLAISPVGRGLPFGPYSADQSKNAEFYPATGSGWIGDPETDPDNTN